MRVAVKASQGPKPGTTTHTMIQGSTPRRMNTANRIPQVRNHLRALACMVGRTSALMMALSMLVTVSKRARPRTMRMVEGDIHFRVTLSDLEQKSTGERIRGNASIVKPKDFFSPPRTGAPFARMTDRRGPFRSEENSPSP